MSYEKLRKLASVIGEEKTNLIVVLFSGEHIWIPTTKSLHNAARNEMIIREYRHGMRQREIAVRHNLKENTIKKIISRHARREQAGLFDNPELKKGDNI